MWSSCSEILPPRLLRLDSFGLGEGTGVFSACSVGPSSCASPGFRNRTDFRRWGHGEQWGGEGTLYDDEVLCRSPRILPTRWAGTSSGGVGLRVLSRPEGPSDAGISMVLGVACHTVNHCPQISIWSSLPGDERRRCSRSSTCEPLRRSPAKLRNAGSGLAIVDAGLVEVDGASDLIDGRRRMHDRFLSSGR